VTPPSPPRPDGQNGPARLPARDDPRERSLPTTLTVPEVARLLRCNRKTIYAAIRRNELPGARRIGGVIRISSAALHRWLGAADADDDPT
jgi:excisionase family DNA binding protein